MTIETVSATYVGGTAAEYEQVRVGKKWDGEHQAIRQLLAYVPEGSRVVDIPTGTGRLYPFFKERGFKVYGLDVSTDMIEQAREKAKAIGADFHIGQSDIQSIPYDDGFFELVVCLRFLNLVDRRTVEPVLRELKRVSGDKLLIGIRYITPVSELQLSNTADLVRLATWPLWIARRLLRGSKRKVQDEAFVTAMLDRLGVRVLSKMYVERRWDCTDYVLLLLQKPGAGERPARPNSGRHARDQKPSEKRIAAP